MNKKEIIKLISKAINIKDNKLNNNSGIGSVPEWDSLGHLNIFFALQKKLKKKIDLNEASKIRNINDWYKLISKLQFKYGTKIPFCSIIEQYGNFYLAKNKLVILIFIDLFFTKHSLLGKNVQYLNIYE